MEKLEIIATSQIDGVQIVELQIAGITKASFSITTEMTIDEVRNQFERALNGLPKEIIITMDTVKELLQLLIPGFFQRIIIYPPQLSEIENSASGVEIDNSRQAIVQRLEDNFRFAMKQSYSGTRIEQFLVNNGYYNFSEKCFDFSDFLLGEGVLYALYSEKYSKGVAIDRLKYSSNSVVNIGNKTFEVIIDFLIESGFPIS